MTDQEKRKAIETAREAKRVEEIASRVGSGCSDIARDGAAGDRAWKTASRVVHARQC
jgi:hypothetical protein